ncbi:MAG TPA: SHOCT domain-containing protein [Burkholderiales bacterium]|nr:SHOCT domain-containing protein [Burkholderiales bacterium]
MKSPLRAVLFVLLVAAFVPAHAQRGVLVSPLPDGLDNKQVLDLAGQVLTRRGWTLVPQDSASLEAEKERTGLRLFLSDRALRFTDLSQRPRGVRQREQREEGSPLTALPQEELNALRTDLAAAFAGQKRAAGATSIAERPQGQVLMRVAPGSEAERVMDKVRVALSARAWKLLPDEEGAVVAQNRSGELEARIKIFLAGDQLRFIDQSTRSDSSSRRSEKIEKAQVPERWMGYLRADLDKSLRDLTPRKERRPLAREGAAKDGDPAERLKKLKSLLDGGLITQAEYDAKRSEILNGL